MLPFWEVVECPSPLPQFLPLHSYLGAALQTEMQLGTWQLAKDGGRSYSLGGSSRLGGSLDLCVQTMHAQTQTFWETGIRILVLSLTPSCVTLDEPFNHCQLYYLVYE